MQAVQGLDCMGGLVNGQEFITKANKKLINVACNCIPLVVLFV